MQPKPRHLGLEYAEQFKDQSIVDVYHHRQPYSPEIIAKLLELVSEEPRTVLDVGCGTGDVARRLAPSVERVDAVDFSQAMIARGKTLPGGDHPHLNWIYGRVEEVALQPPYALITAGESLHWMEWDVVLPLFRRILTPHGYLSVVGREIGQECWRKELLDLIVHYSTNKEFVPYDLIEALESRHLFKKLGEIYSQPVPFVQSPEQYIDTIHSRNGFSRDRMSQHAASAFDAATRSLLAPYLHDDGLLHLTTVSTIVWGEPFDP